MWEEQLLFDLYYYFVFKYTYYCNAMRQIDIM